MMKKRAKVWELAAALGAVLLLLAGLAAVVATPSPGWFQAAAGKDEDQGPSPQALDWLDERYVNEGQPDAVTGAMISDGSVGIGDVSPEVQAFLSDLESRLTALEQQPTPTPTPSTDLVGYWKLDEGLGITASDSSGWGNNGTLLNGPTWVDGKLNKALSLDGVDDYVSVPDSDSLDIKSFTITLWMKVATGAAGWTTPVGKPGAYWVEYNPTNGVLQYASTVGGVGTTRISATVNLDREIWYFIAVSNENGGDDRLYVNDVLKASELSEGVPDSSGNALTIGEYSGYQRFNGVIDQVAVWNRALTPQEILARFQNP